jgi:parallel beta-helix repeat protein
MIPLRRLALSFVLLGVVVTRAVAADYFVKNGGSDGADGLTLATAWATLGHTAGVVNPGDTVHVQNGSYQGFDLERPGSPGNPITFVADGTAVQITADNGTTPDGINVENTHDVVIDGFIVNDRTRAGIRVAESQFVTVRNCHTGHNGTWGIFSGHAYDFTIENNETYESQTQHGIYVSNSGDRPIIRGNIVHDNYANGIHMNGDASEEDPGEDGLISNALVERNVIYGNGVGGGSGINMDGVTDSVVQNNLLYDNHASGISLYQIDGATGSTNNLVVNNTIIEASDARWCVNINTGSTGNHVINNILYNYHSFHGVISIDSSSRPSFVSDYNSVMDRFSTDQGDTVIGLAAWQALGYDAHSFIATPTDLFVVPTSDFHLSATSPALDTGTVNQAPSEDLDGNPRPVGTGVDVGAYERQLLHCGDGNVDPGEQCGEPGLSCSDPCTQCSGCTCVTPAPVCGDNHVCGNEQCEADADCTAGQICSGCACVNASACTSGITIAKPSLRLRATPFSLTAKGQAVIPKPWQGVDPIANGIRLVVDAVTGPGGLDVTLPGGAAVNGIGWTINGSGTTWTYRDKAGTQGGITKAVLKNRSQTTDGLLQWSITGKSGTSLALPDVTMVRTATVLGAPGECASVAWNPPSGVKPRCTGSAAKLACH